MIVYLFAFIGFNSILLSCVHALDAWLSDNPSAPKFLSRLVSIFWMLSFWGYFAHPFQTYLNNRAYDRMMNRVRAARFLAGLDNYPSDSDCNRYGFFKPSLKSRCDLSAYFAEEDAWRVMCIKEGLPFSAPLRDHEALDDFNDWRNHEYTKLGL